MTDKRWAFAQDIIAALEAHGRNVADKDEARSLIAHRISYGYDARDIAARLYEGGHLLGGNGIDADADTISRVIGGTK